MIDLINNVTFQNPEYFLFLVILPILWKYFKEGPDRPVLKKFPAIILIAQNTSSDSTPIKKNYLNLVLKILLVFLITILLANPSEKKDFKKKPLIIIDNGWDSGPGWEKINRGINQLLESKKLNTFTIFPTVVSNNNKFNYLFKKKEFEIREYLKDISPLALKPNYNLLLKELPNFIEDETEIFWFTNHHMNKEKKAFYDSIKAKNLKIFTSLKKDFPIILSIENQDDNIYTFGLINMKKDLDNFFIDCYDEKQRIIIRKKVSKDKIKYDEQNFGNFSIEIPKEKNDLIYYFKISNSKSVSSVAIKSNYVKKKKIGLIQTNFQENDNEYFRANFFVRKALEQNYDLMSLPLEQLLYQNKSLIISDDFDTTIFGFKERILQWIGEGGTFLKFAGDKFLNHAENNQFSSVLGIIPITKKVVSLDGELSFKKNLSIAQISSQSPIRDFEIPKRIKINKYIEIPNNIDNSQLKYWVRLDNGAPLITQRTYKKGNLILVHLPANNEWSNISLSIFFPDLLEKIIQISRGIDAEEVQQIFKPLKILDALGNLVEPSIDTLNLDSKILMDSKLTRSNPPGLYKNELGFHGLNISDYLQNEYDYIDLPQELIVNNFNSNSSFEIKNVLVLLCLLVFVCETLVNFLGRDFLKFKYFNPLKVMILTLIVFSPNIVSTNEKFDYLEQTKLAYIQTGVEEIDDINYKGLSEISSYISSKTSAILGNPIGLNLEKDEIDYFPIIYISLINNAKKLNDVSLKKLQNFINSGGILLFDCKASFESLFVEDCLILFNQRYRGLDITAFKKLTSESTLSKSFYLLNSYPGRKNEMVYVAYNNQINNDKVLSIVIGNNDWTGAWAKDTNNSYLLPLFENDQKQRDLSLRFGVNIVLYALTGNYKSDQVHIPEILKRMNK